MPTHRTIQGESITNDTNTGAVSTQSSRYTTDEPEHVTLNSDKNLICMQDSYTQQCAGLFLEVNRVTQWLQGQREKMTR